jgi:hypothetical protein
MPLFTNPWSDNIPADTQFANLLGADIRQLRLDIDQRMTNYFASDWSTNQNGLTLVPGAGGQVAGIVAPYPAAQFVTSNPPGNWYYTYASADNSFSVTTTSGSVGGIIVMCPINIPIAGDIVNSCVLNYDQAASIGTMTAIFAYTQPGMGSSSPVTVGSVNTSNNHTGGIQTATIFSGTFTMVGGSFFIAIGVPSTSVVGTLLKIYGAGISYTRPGVQYAP